jgi:hypothetical protein
MILAMLVCSVGAALGQTNAIIPTMTDSNAPSPFVVSEYTSGTKAYGYAPWLMFDSDANNAWAFGQINSASVVGSYVKIFMGSSKKPVALYQFSKNASGSTYYPTAFTLSGSQDGTNWNVLDDRTGQTFAGTVSPLFAVPSTNIASYEYVKFVVNDIAEPTWRYTLNIASMTFWEVIQPLPAIAVLGGSAATGVSVLGGQDSGSVILQ